MSDKAVLPKIWALFRSSGVVQGEGPISALQHNRQCPKVHHEAMCVEDSTLGRQVWDTYGLTYLASCDSPSVKGLIFGQSTK